MSNLSLEQCRKLQAAGCPGARVSDLALTEISREDYTMSTNAIHPHEPSVEEMMGWLYQKYVNGDEIYLQYDEDGWIAISPVWDSDCFATPLSALYDLWEKLEAGK